LAFGKAKLALIVLVLLALALSACGRFRNNERDENGESTDVIIDVTETPEEPEEIDIGALPFELTIHFNSGLGIFDASLPQWQLVSELTNVHFTGTANPNITCPDEAFADEASQGFQSYLYGGISFAEHFIQYGMYGYFLSLNELIENYAPNISELFESFPDFRIASTAPDGNIYFLPVFASEGVLDLSFTWFIRNDWLDLLHLSTPTTVQELENVLIAFRDQMPGILGVTEVVPLVYGSWLNAMRLTNLWGSRAFGNSDYNVRVAPRENSDELFHTWTDPQFKSALIQISRWFEMGLIDRNLFNRGLGARFELLSQNLAGAVFDCPISTEVLNEIFKETIDGYNLARIWHPFSDDSLPEHRLSNILSQSWAISANNPDPTSTIRLIDFLYGRQGSTILSLADGDFNVDSHQQTALQGSNVFLPFANPLADEAAFIGARRIIHHSQISFDEEGTAVHETIASHGPIARQLPTMNFTPQERETIYKIESELNVFLDAEIQAMIIGGRALIESRWDYFLEEANDLGLEELVATYQQAFDRSMSFN